MLEKWTQRPPAASILTAEKDFDLFMQNVRGCGGQVRPQHSHTTKNICQHKTGSAKHPTADCGRANPFKGFIRIRGTSASQDNLNIILITTLTCLMHKSHKHLQLNCMRKNNNLPALGFELTTFFLPEHSFP